MQFQENRLLYCESMQFVSYGSRNFAGQNRFRAGIIGLPCMKLVRIYTCSLRNESFSGPLEMAVEEQIFPSDREQGKNTLY